MTNLLITIVVGIAIALVLGYSSLELFQSARDNYDQQMLWMRLEQAGTAIKSKIKIVDGLPVLPMPDMTGTYPTMPKWITANSLDTQNHNFVYCPYALRPTMNVEGPTATIPGAGYNVVTYGSAMTDDPNSASVKPSGTLTPSATSGTITLTAGSSVFSASSVGKSISGNKGNAIITAYTSGTNVTANVGTPFVSTSAITSGNWALSPNTYVVGSDKPSFYATTPAATVTPGATSGYGVTFTAGSSVFTAANVGQTISNGTGSAVITGYTSGTVVTATITIPFASTSAIASGNWTLGASPPKGLLGYLIAFKPHDTYSATIAQQWCNSSNPINITSAGLFTTTGTSVAGLVYPIIAAQSLYQQAIAKQDLVTLYVATSAAGDGTGRNPANAITLDGAMSQLAALRPYRAKIWLTTGTHTLSNAFASSSTVTTPAATLTPNATSVSATFTAGSSVFSATNIGATITTTNGSGTAIITGYNSGTSVTATILSPFAGTSAIASGGWQLISPALSNPNTTITPGAILGVGVTLTAGNGVFSTANIGQKIVGNSGVAVITGYTDSSHVVATITSSFANTSAIAANGWSLIGNGEIYDRANLRQIQYDFQGTGSGTTIISLSGNLDIPVNVILRSLTVTPNNYNVRVQPGTHWIANNTRLANVIIQNGEMWVNGTSNLNTAVTVSEGGRLVINGTVSSNLPSSGFDLQPGRVDVLPGTNWTINSTTITNPPAPIIVRAGGKLSNSGAMSFNALVPVSEAINIVPGGFFYMNNATLSINSVLGTNRFEGDNTGSNCPGPLSSCKCPGAICLGGEMYMDNSIMTFPQGTAAKTAAVVLVDGGKFYMHNNSIIGSSSNAFLRPYWGVYDNGGSFVGGSSTGYSSGANGEGGSPQSNIYVATSSGAACWAGNPLPNSPVSGSSQQQRGLFMDSPEGNNAVSSPRGTVTTTGAGDIDLRHLILANQTDWKCTSANSITSPSLFAFASSGAASCNASYTTEVIEPTNYNSSATISIAGSGSATSPQYSINGGAFTSSSGTISPGQTVRVKVYEASANSSISSATLTIGSQNATVTTQTSAACYASAPPNSGITVYVANFGDNTISVRDVATNAITATWSGLSGAWSIALSPDGTKAYVSNASSNTIYVVNTSNGSTTATWSLPYSSYRGIAISSDGTTAYSASASGNAISVINTSNGSVITNWPSGALLSPRGVALSPDGTKLYVANTGPDNVLVFNTADGSLVATWTGFNSPKGIAASTDGSKVYVTSYDTNIVNVVNASNGSILSAFTTTYSGLIGIAVSSDGTRLYVATQGNNSIDVLDASTGAEVGDLTGFNAPELLLVQ